MTRDVISTTEAPQAIGPYSQAIHAGGMLFTSGQIALDPATGTIVGTDDVAVQTRRCMDNLKAVLTAAGTDFSRVAKTTIFLVDMGDFAKVNEVYAEYFQGFAPPARSTVAVKELPRAVRVEIECIAIVA